MGQSYGQSQTRPGLGGFSMCEVPIAEVEVPSHLKLWKRSEGLPAYAGDTYQGVNAP